MATYKDNHQPDLHNPLEQLSSVIALSPLSSIDPHKIPLIDPLTKETFFFPDKFPFLALPRCVCL